jgi:hypothetical protein
VLAAPIPSGDVSVGSTPRSLYLLYRPRPSASVAALSRPSVRSIPAPQPWPSAHSWPPRLSKVTLCAHAEKLWPGAPAHAAARSWVTDLYGPRGLRRSQSPSVSTPLPVAWSRVAPARWSGRRLALVKRAGRWAYRRRYKCDRWVRADASEVQVRAEPAPAPAQWGW